MAVTLTRPIPAMEAFALSGTPDVVTLLSWPQGVTHITLRPRASDAKLVIGSKTTGIADGDPLGATDYLTLAADTYHEVSVLGLSNQTPVTSLLVASAVASVVIEAIAEVR